LDGLIGVFLILEGKLSVGALVAARTCSGRLLATDLTSIAAEITRATQTFHCHEGDEPRDVARRERPPERQLTWRARSRKGAVAFQTTHLQVSGRRDECSLRRSRSH